MRRVNFEQGSTEWLQWRKGLITATDAPMLMGASPYATPFQCWQRKTGQLPEQQENEAMRRGKLDEPIAREWFIKEYGIDMQPCCIESNTFNFLGASLDGLSSCGKYILEIKSNGDQYHFGLNAGLPDFHMMQIQHQLLCTDNSAEMAFYLSWNKGSPIVKEVYPDLEWMNNYLTKAREFWQKIVFFEAPELTHKDYKDMSTNADWTSCAIEYKNLIGEIKTLEEIKEVYRNKLISMCGDQSCAGSGIKILKKQVKGRIDYKEILEDHKIIFDENEYRKPSTSSWAIMLDEK